MHIECFRRRRAGDFSSLGEVDELEEAGRYPPDNSFNVAQCFASAPLAMFA